MREFHYRTRDGLTRVLINVDHGEAIDELTRDHTKVLVIASKSIVNQLRTSHPTIIIGDGEESKDMSTVLTLIGKAHSMGLDRDGLIVGVGGGSVLDTVGFTASIYMRGVDYVNVPTTMLSMVDAALGGKTAVNAMGIKNVIGIIRQPRAIIVDLGFLRTLPEHNYLDGFGEVIKYGVTLDRDLLNYVITNHGDLRARDPRALEYVITRSLTLKARIVEEDEEDRLSVRLVLNYGHTVGHAIESATNFSISHGRAVSMGMVCEAQVGVRLGFTREYVVDVLIKALGMYDLLTKNLPLNNEALIKAMLSDKKRSGSVIKLPVVTQVGSWAMVKVPIEEFTRMVTETCRFTQ
ncbi:3-dehydroquinate synthase [Vulcanisaeta thermophila]|uniref:3-dehydroquinate synthase n=1 Tax=Vulcanisaeta thermophila TaxID=867917 RepID=UPI000852B4A5|nr:3-dehydroquinate synthase [Vulcanisaeta thermophila]